MKCEVVEELYCCCKEVIIQIGLPLSDVEVERLGVAGVELTSCEDVPCSSGFKTLREDSSLESVANIDIIEIGKSIRDSLIQTALYEVADVVIVLELLRVVLERW